MPFIEELVVCCPDKMAPELRERYNGRLNLVCITDSQLLNGKPLPEDHTKRNFFLRCLMVQRAEIDDVFIMSDDDYRPICNIKITDFIKDGRYIARYFDNLSLWYGPIEPYPYDNGAFRNRAFSENNGLTKFMYDSHIPQPIDKRIYLEILSKYKGIEETGLTEWSPYFNYVYSNYPTIIQNTQELAITWPCSPLSIDLKVISQSRFLFENFYSHVYDQGKIFAGLSKTYYDGIERESIEKVVRYMAQISLVKERLMAYHLYREYYKYSQHEYPLYKIKIFSDNCQIFVPKYLFLPENCNVLLQFQLENASECDSLIYNWDILDSSGGGNS